MASGSRRLRWAAKAQTAAVFGLAGAMIGAGLYFGNLAYVRASDVAARAAAARQAAAEYPHIVTTSLPSELVGLPYATNLAASGGVGSYRWSATGLPPGMIIDSRTGGISGTASAAGRYVVRVTVSDSTHPQPRASSLALDLTVVTPLTVTPNSVPTGVVGRLYTAVFTVSGGDGVYTWAAVTGLPAGLTATAHGRMLTISGTASAAGHYPATVVVEDLADQTDTVIPVHFVINAATSR